MVILLVVLFNGTMYVFGDYYYEKYSNLRWEVNGIYYTTALGIQDESQVKEVYVTHTEEKPFDYYNQWQRSGYIGDIIIPSYIIISGNKVPVTQITDYAFYRSKVNSVKLPESLIKIGKHSFDESKISIIVFPSSLKEIEAMAFAKTANLKSVVIPSTIEYVGNYAFEKSGIEKVEYMSSYDGSSGQFDRCEELSSVTLSPEMKSIPNCMFDECRSLKNIIIPDKVESIGTLAFFAMGKPLEEPGEAESITLGESVKIIYYAAFHEVYLNKMICLPLTPPEFSLDDGTSHGPTKKPHFNDYTYSNGILYVPAESIEDYRKADGWKEFKHIMPIDLSSIDEISVSGKDFNIMGNTLSVETDSDTPVNIYTIDGILFHKGSGPAEIELPSGLYILQMGPSTYRVRI